MATAANLREAAGISYNQMTLVWVANTLDTACAAFIAAVSPLFEDAIPNDRIVGNWLVLLQAVVDQMPTGVVSVTVFNSAVEIVYRMCFAGFTALASNLISNTQATAMLAAWNAAFGT